MSDFPDTRPSLLVRLRNPHDEKAWTEFVELYTPLVYGYARKQGLQEADAADLAQEVFSAVAGAVGRLDYDPCRGSFRNWLFTVVRHNLSDYRSAQRNRTRGSGDSSTQRVLEQCAAPDGMEAEWESEWRERVFAWACEQVRREVTDSTWQSFWQTAVVGKSCKKVADELCQSVTAVYVARSRVLARLKECVQSVQEP